MLSIMSQRSRNSRKRGRGRSGVAAAEMALVLPVLLLAIMGMLEFGRAFMVQQIITNAAREGARRAVIPNATYNEVYSLVDDYLNNTSLGASGKQIQVSMPDGRRSIVSVTVGVSHDEVGLIGMFLGGQNLTASVQMRKE